MLFFSEILEQVIFTSYYGNIYRPGSFRNYIPVHLIPENIPVSSRHFKKIFAINIFKDNSYFIVNRNIRTEFIYIFKVTKNEHLIISLAEKYCIFFQRF